MNKREFYHKLVKALRTDGYFMAHTNNDAYDNPYQVTLYYPVDKYTTKSPITFVVKCHKNIVSIYSNNLTLLKEMDSDVDLTVKQLKELASKTGFTN